MTIAVSFIAAIWLIVADIVSYMVRLSARVVFMLLIIGGNSASICGMSVSRCSTSPVSFPVSSDNVLIKCWCCRRSQ